jgi:hypothetical protein
LYTHTQDGDEDDLKNSLHYSTSAANPYTLTQDDDEGDREDARTAQQDQDKGSENPADQDGDADEEEGEDGVGTEPPQASPAHALGRLLTLGGGDDAVLLTGMWHDMLTSCNRFQGNAGHVSCTTGARGRQR